MGKQYQSWGQNALTASIISLGIAGAVELPTEAGVWQTQSSLKLAQVSDRSQIAPPTPLNLRPRTHIPLPTNSRSRDYYGYPRYRGSYRHDKYRSHHHHHRHHTYDRDRRRGGKVIIINPAESYSNSNHYIRIIKK